MFSTLDTDVKKMEDKENETKLTLKGTGKENELNNVHTRNKEKREG